MSSVKYILVGAFGDGLRLGFSDYQFDDLDSLKAYAVNECYISNEEYEDLLRGRSVSDIDSEAWYYLIEVRVG